MSLKLLFHLNSMFLSKYFYSEQFCSLAHTIFVGCHRCAFNFLFQWQYYLIATLCNEKSLDKCLQRALDLKVKKLRTLLTADQDITTELDRVVCRLMKLALRTSGDRDVPPPTSWLQFKLLDLLTLTERAIERRKRHFINKNTLTAVGYDDYYNNKTIDKLDIFKINESDTAMEIENKYSHFVECKHSCNGADFEQKSIEDSALYEQLKVEDNMSGSSNELVKNGEDFKQKSIEDASQYEQMKVEDNMSETSNEFVKIYDYSNQDSDSSHARSHTSRIEHNEYSKVEKDTTSETKFKSIAYLKLVNDSGVRSSGDTDHSVKISNRSRCKTLHNKCNDENIDVLQIAKVINIDNKKMQKKEIKGKYKHEGKKCKKIPRKKIIAKKSLCTYLIKNNISSIEYEHFKIGMKKKFKQHRQLRSSMSKPIPNSLIKFCHQNMNTTVTIDGSICTLSNNHKIPILKRSKESIADTKESCLIEIVTDCNRSGETIALRRSIATDTNDRYLHHCERLSAQEFKAEEVPYVKKDKSFISEHKSQTIFLYDINEPSTSKGVCHVNMNVQCGLDAAFLCSVPSATKSLTRLSTNFTNITNAVSGEDKTTECDLFLSSSVKSNGIQIKDSDLVLYKNDDSCHKTHFVVNYNTAIEPTSKHLAIAETEIVCPKQLSNIIKSEDTFHDCRQNAICVSNLEQYEERPFESLFPVTCLSKEMSKAIIRPFINKEVEFINNISLSKPTLAFGGVLIHSYRDRKTCEDIIYQGEWQRFVPKTLDRKNRLDTIVFKRMMKQSYDKRRNFFPEEQQRKLQKTDISNIFNDHQQRVKIWSEKLKSQSISKKADRGSKKTSSKVVLKIVKSSDLPRSKKNKYVNVNDKKPLMNSSATNEKNVVVKHLAKSYIPQYLRTRKRNFLDNNKLKQCITVNVEKRDNKRKCLHTNSRTKEIKSGLLKFIREPRQNKPLKYSSATNENNVIVKNSAKNYIPQNLKARKLIFLDNNKLKQSIDPVNVEESDIKRKYLRTNSKMKDIKGDLLKFMREPRQNISYTIFRNKIENENDINMRNLCFKTNNSIKIVRNVQSANSSCSSINSAKTIKQLSPNNKESQFKIKASKSTLVNNINRSSKLFKKDANKSSPLFDDKENSPESSKTSEKENIQFLGWSKKPLMFKNTVSMHKKKLSHVDISKNFDSVDRKNCKSSTSICRKVSLHEPRENIVSKNQVDIGNPNLVLVLESCKDLNMDYKKLSSQSPSREAIREKESLDTKLCTSFNSGNNIANYNESIDIKNEVLSIIEERLNFIENSSNAKISISKQNESLILEGLNKSCEKLNCFTDNSLENEFTANSLYSGSKPVDADLISFKSFASISGYSEYFLADSELSATLDSFEIFTSPERSMQNIFEKNNKLCIPSTDLALQTFSGFSINKKNISEQPDSINLVDSETGSVEHGVEVRRVISEEVFTSGRSSDTYVSCQIDDDNMVPHWLFHLMNQQHSDEEEPQHFSPPIPLHSIEPHLDVNGNVMEPGGLGAGAGDGCGIHSDQDSSGRDTSMSSTETSSGQHSEAILVDPSAYTAHIEFVREPSNHPFSQVTSAVSPDLSFRTTEGPENDNIFNTSEDSVRNVSLLGTIQSDRDADVSSLDTDIADFSDI